MSDRSRLHSWLGSEEKCVTPQMIHWGVLLDEICQAHEKAPDPETRRQLVCLAGKILDKLSSVMPAGAPRPESLCVRHSKTLGSSTAIEAETTALKPSSGATGSA